MVWESGNQLQSGKYTIDKELGEGGFGITYRARDNNGRDFVIKTLNKTLQRRPDFAKFQQDFLNEAIKLAKCTHPHIVRIDEVIQEGALWCMVMEYIDGEDLANLVENQGALSEVNALRYIQQIGAALTVVHNNGLLHRDIKPQNIMLRSGNSEAVLIDFGIARDFTPNLTHTHTQMLADGFAPVEQYDKRAKRGAYSDVYALAATLYAILTGEVPTMSPVRAIGTPLVEPKKINSSISERVNKAIIKGMEIKPENRPQSIEEWLKLIWLEGQANNQQPLIGIIVLVHLAEIGDKEFRNGEFAGTRGQSRRLEGFKLSIVPRIPDLSISYMAHLQNTGDTPWVNEGKFIGSRGEHRRLEGFAINLTGSESSKYNVFYMCHLEDISDSPVYSNGQFCGTRKQSRRLEGLKVWIERK